MNTPIAIQAATLSDDPRQAARMARTSGFAGIQFNAFTPQMRLPDLSATGRREFRHLLASNNLQLVGLRAETGKKGLGPGADVDRLLHQVERVMETAASLAAGLLCLDVGPLPAPPREKKNAIAISPQQAGDIIIPPPLTAIPDTARESTPTAIDPVFVSEVDGALAELGRLADRYNVILALGSDLAGFAAIERALHKADCPWFGLDLSPISLLRDEWPIDELFSRLGPLIRHVQGRDALLGDNHRTKPAPVGQGDTKWTEILHALDSSHYHGWITIDPTELPHRSAAAMAGQKYLSQL